MGPANLPSFVIKLWKMTNNAKFLHVISWNEAGTAFIIYDQIAFISELLPMYFKHNNMGSFVRQLNLYDFHKVCFDRNNILEYQHKYFQRGRFDLLKSIARKLPRYKRVMFNKSEKEEVSNLGMEVASLNQQLTEMNASQDKMALQIFGIQRENRALISQLRSVQYNHLKQTQGIRRVLELLIPFVQTCAQDEQEAEGTRASSFMGFDPHLVEKLEDMKRTDSDYSLNQNGAGSSMVSTAPTQRSLQLYSEPASTMDLQRLDELVSYRDMLAAESSQAQHPADKDQPLLDVFSVAPMDFEEIAQDDKSLSSRFEPDESGNETNLGDLDKQVDILLKSGVLDSVLVPQNYVSMMKPITEES